MMAGTKTGAVEREKSTQIKATSTGLVDELRCGWVCEKNALRIPGPFPLIMDSFLLQAESADK